MENRLPQARAALFSQAESMMRGCREHEAALALAQNMEANVIADLTAARTAENDYQAGKTAKLTAVQIKNAADKTVRAFIVTARDVLKPHLGTSWSQRWVEAGFINNSFALPKAQAARAALLMNLHLYFLAHPAHEVAQMGITAAAAATHHETLRAAHSATNDGRADRAHKKTARATAERKLRKRMRGLIAELKQLLPPDDARWTAFGLNQPAARPVPSAPTELKVTGAGAGHLLLTWDAPPYAKRFHLFKQVVGVNEDFVSAGTVSDRSANLNTFNSGAKVRVRVSAVNDAGESAPSDTVEQTVP